MKKRKKIVSVKKYKIHLTISGIETINTKVYAKRSITKAKAICSIMASNLLCEGTFKHHLDTHFRVLLFAQCSKEEPVNAQRRVVLALAVGRWGMKTGVWRNCKQLVSHYEERPNGLNTHIVQTLTPTDTMCACKDYENHLLWRYKSIRFSYYLVRSIFTKVKLYALNALKIKPVTPLYFSKVTSTWKNKECLNEIFVLMAIFRLSLKITNSISLIPSKLYTVYSMQFLKATTGKSFKKFNLNG